MVREAALLELPSDLPELPVGWGYRPLGELVTSPGICYGIVQPGSESTDGVPIVRVNNIRDGRIDTSDVKRVQPEVAEAFARSKLKGGEVLLTLVGTLGEVAIAPAELAGWNVARAVGVIPVNGDVNNRWVSLCLRSALAQRYIQMWATTTVQATFNLRDVARLPIPLPPKGERDAIAGILSALDDKIELNRRMNETLEALARAIFKSWFVDFDPVRAKMDGRHPPGLSPATASLFPDAFEHQSNGTLIPAGWTPVPLPNAFDFKEGPGLRNWQYTEEGMRFLNIRCIVDGDLDVQKANCISIGEFHEKYEHFSLQTDDVVISTSGTLGRLAIVRDDHLPVMLNTSIVRMRGIAPFRMCFIWAYLQSAYFLDEMFAMASGSVQLNFGPMHLNRMSVLRPNNGVLEAFEARTESIIRRVLANRKESNSLAAIRDALLPKLLSGEIRVGEAEKLVEEAV